ncbi:MAG: hypothetical protein U5R30_08255 [Deltaproteobacteria bacterium]|nr:hypothetical protein [Deltaproteobacteria bacterium]
MMKIGVNFAGFISSSSFGVSLAVVKKGLIMGRPPRNTACYSLSTFEFYYLIQGLGRTIFFDTGVTVRAAPSETCRRLGF